MYDSDELWFRMLGLGSAHYAFIAGRSRKVKKYPIGFVKEQPKRRPPKAAKKPPPTKS